METQINQFLFSSVYSKDVYIKKYGYFFKVGNSSIGSNKYIILKFSSICYTHNKSLN